MPTPTNTLIPEKYDYNQIAQRLSTLQPSEDIGTRMGKAFADSATGIVQNLVEVGADIHDTVVPEGYESMLNPLAKGIESVKEDIGYRSGIDFQGMQEGLRNDGLSGFWSKFKFEDIPELMAQSFPYMVGAYNAAGFAAISASMAKEMAKNTAVNEGRDPNQTTLSDTLTALPAGMAITALDSLIPNTMTANVMKSIVGRSATTAANRVADRGISTLIKDVATSVVTEGATESVQELIQFAQEHKGQGVLSPEALSQYGVAGLLGGMSGGTMNVAMKPVETISSIMPSKTAKPAIDSLEAGEIDTRQVDILNKKVNTDTFQSLPEEEKMNIIDNAVFNSPLEVIDNKAKVVLSDGSGMFEVDLTIADDATSFGKLIRSDGTEVELTGGYGQYLDMIYGSIYNKIQSFDTVESLNKFMEQSGLDKVDPTNNVVHTAVANKAAEIQSMLLNEKAKSQTKGSFGTGIDTSNLYGAMNDIHTNFMKEMTNKTEKELFASIGRLVFNPDTLQPRNRQASKKVQALKDLVTAEEQYMLYRYIQQYGNVNNSNTKKVAAFIEKQYGIKTTYYNKIGMFKFSSISEPVVEQPIIPAVSPSPKIEIQPTSTTTGSDMENNKVDNTNKPIEKESTIPEVNNKQETVKSTKQENIPVEKENKESAVADTTETPLTEQEQKSINNIFNKFPKLMKLFNGNTKLYQQYLNNIFPNSKVKDIVYHGSYSNDIKKFDKQIESRTSLTGYLPKAFYFSNQEYVASTYTASKDIKNRNVWDSLVNVIEGIKDKNGNYSREPQSFDEILSYIGKNTNDKSFVIDYRDGKLVDYAGGAEEIGLTLPNKEDTNLYLSLIKNKDIDAIKKKRDEYSNEEGNIYSVVLDIQKPLYKKSISGSINTIYTKGKTNEDISNNLNEELKNSDGLIISNIKDASNYKSKKDIVYDKSIDEQTYVVFEPEQIHILGSDEDIKKAEEFIKNNNIADTTKTQSNIGTDIVNDTNKVNKISVKKGNKKVSYTLFNSVTGKNETKTGYRLTIPEFPNVELYITKETGNKKWEIEISHPTKGVLTFPTGYATTISDVLNSFVYDVNNKYSKNEEHRKILSEIGIHISPKESIVEKSAKKSITIGGINIEYESVPEDSIKSLAVNGKDGIKIQKNITKDKFIKYLKGELANDAVSKNIIAIKQQADNMMKDKYGKSLIEIVDKLSDNDIRKFILLHEHRHNMQRAVDRSNNEYKTFIEAYKANPAKFEFDANEFALLKMGLISKPKEGVDNGLQEQETTEEVVEEIPVEEVREQSKDFTGITPDGISARNTNRMVKAKNIATKLGMDLSTQISNLQNELKQFRTSILGMLPSTEQLDRQAIHGKNFNKNFANDDYIKTLQIDNKSGLYYVTSLLGAINSIKSNQPLFISRYDEDTETYVEILSNEQVEQVNNFGGVRLEEVVNTIARTLTNEFNLRPTDKFDDNANNTINEQAYKGALLAIKSLVSTGKLEELSIQDKDKVIHRFYKLADDSVYDNVSIFAKELDSRDIKSPNFVLDVNSNENPNIVDKTQLRSNGVKVSKKTEKALRMLQKQSYKINLDMQDILLDDALMNDSEFINNIIHFDNPANHHPNFREQIESTNNAYKRTLDRLIDFVKLAKDEEEFWFKYQVNSNGRFQPYATVANPVSDKLFARWIVDNSHSNAMYEVTKNGTDKTTYQWKHSIVLAFSEAKLIDFKSPDKKDGKANLEAFDSIANSTTISDALKLLSQGKKSEAVKLVSKGGLHSIRAFLDYAKYVELSDNESFDTSMPTEVDGITNGLVMQLMQVFNGAKASTVPYLKMVGVYLKGGDVNSIYDYRNRGNDDIYTTVANQVIRYLENTPAKEFLSAIDAMSRSVAKSPVMVWLYNAGNYGIEMKVGSSVVENFMEVAYQDSLKEPKNRTITAEMLDGMHMFYIDEISKLEDNKIQVSKEQFKELLNKVVKGTKLSEKDILNLETAFGLSVGKQITNSMEQQFNGISNAKNIFSEVSQFINESFYKTYKTIGRKAYLEQITISGHKDTESGVSTYTNDKELNPDKRYGIYYNNNGKVSVVSTSPIEKVVQNPFNKEGKPRGQKRGFVVLTHNLDATVMADSVIDFIGKNKYFGFPIFDAFVGSASSMNDFMSTYNNNLYRINKDYSNLEALQQALISAKDLLSKYNLLTKVNQNKFNELDTLVAESINQNNAMRKDMYSDTGIDVNHINQMSGIQPYEEYEQSLSQGSSSDSITGTLTETRVLKKDTNDFVELFDEIKQLDEVPVEENHSKYLRDLVGYIQNRLGDYQKETKVDIYKDAVSNAGEYYAENIKLSIGNKVSSYAYQSMQEIYAHELVHKAVDKAFKTDAKTRNELNVIFNKFIDYVKSNNTTLPKATFDYILSVNDASEFASYAVTNKDVMNVLEQIPSTLPSKSTGKRKTMFEILSEAVKLMISKFMTVTRLENSSLKLLTAKNAREEVDIVIAEMMAVNKQFNSIKKDNIFNQTYKGIGKVNAPISSAIQATTRVIKTSPIGRAFHDSLVNRGMMYRLANNQFVRAFSNEIVRRPKEEEALLKLTKLAINTNSNYINQKRAISNAVNDALNNATTQDRIALKNILLDLDCVSVFNDAKEIGEYLNNKALRYQKIKDIQNSILSMAKTDKQKNYARFIINQAIGLGYNLATHDSILNQAQLLNADNITNFKLVNHSKNVENFAADKVTRELLTKQVDLLATLYGINNSKMSDVALAGKYIAANTSAIDNILEFQLAQVNRSKEQLFNLKGESHLYMKGYSATMLNPNDQYTVIEESKVAGMKKQGWKVLSDVVPTDIKYSSTQHKMVLMRRINVDPNYASGIISVQSPTSKGTTLNQIGLTLPKEDNKINVDSYISNVISDISTMPTGQMIPLLSPSGKTFEVANYRYMMTKNNKTALLGMINDISTVMAETYAMTERKIRENQDNYDLVKAINKDYAEHIDSGEFVKIDNDGEYKDYWRMLPRDTRNYITRHNGEGFIYVRKQLINELFGYTNATVSQALRLKEEHYVLELMEKIWKDMVGIIRNSIVIRTFKVVYDNMFSNFRSVMLFMPADKAFKYMKEAWVLTDQYRKDHDKLTEIEARIASGKPYDKALHSRLKKAVESNPVIELFQEGKFEAIVDDLNIEEHDKRNIVEQKIEQLFDKINSKAVRDAADLVYIGEDTALYKALSKATIYGDFIARYAIYRHLRESNVSKDEAITTIDDMFVKYSVLQNKWIKWTGDMGMFVFSSYFFRIQRGIYRAFRDKSAYVGSQYAIEKITGDTSDITDSFIGGANITARLGTGFRNINEVVEPHLLDNLGLI